MRARRARREGSAPRLVWSLLPRAVTARSALTGVAHVLESRSASRPGAAWFAASGGGYGDGPLHDERLTMIRRIDRLPTELPPPSDPDPAGAAAVQELLGGNSGRCRRS